MTGRLDPAPGYRADPDTFETVLSRAADPPGEDALGVPVESVSFSELRTSEASLDDLKAAIAADLARFNADSVAEVLKKYLGSSIHVV